jgi:hypothetical protein
MIVMDQQIDLAAELVEQHVREALETGDDLRDAAVDAVHAVRQACVWGSLAKIQTSTNRRGWPWRN